MSVKYRYEDQYSWQVNYAFISCLLSIYTLAQLISHCTNFSTISEGKPTRIRRLCLKTFEAEGRGALDIISLSEEVYELML